ncbi:MAG: ATP-binding cassette domain-containing protein [Pyrinomonadaceae bacterium]
MSFLIATDEVSKIYRVGTSRVAALNRVSMGVGAGEFVAVQGTSGSGKSTLLNVLGGLDTPTVAECCLKNARSGLRRSVRWPNIVGALSE